MKINMYPKRDMKVNHDKEKILISIISTVETELDENIRKSYKDCLTLRFDDFPYDIKTTTNGELRMAVDGMKSFDKNDYDKVYEFVNKYPCNSIDIHCGAGVSRSTAVGIGICFMYDDVNLLKETINEKDGGITPNELVLAYFKIYANPVRNGVDCENIRSIIAEKYKRMCD